MSEIELIASLFGGSGTVLLSWWLNRRGLHEYELRRERQMQHQDDLYVNLPTFDPKVQSMLEKISKKTKIDLRIIQLSASYARVPLVFRKDSCGDVTFKMGRLNYEYDTCGDYEVEYFDGIDTMVKEYDCCGDVEMYPKRSIIKCILVGLNVGGIE